MTSTSYARELEIATLAVHRASLLTKRLLSQKDKGTLDKSDASPVTIADFGAQALLIGAVRRNFPEDAFIGEESAAALRADPKLCARVWNVVSEACGDVRGADVGGSVVDARKDEDVLGRIGSVEEMLDLIDLGGTDSSSSAEGVQPSSTSSGRTWILDPVDGTAAFMRNEQYAVCLALVVDGSQKIGVLGCPNLNLANHRVREGDIDAEGCGQLVFATDGGGAWTRAMSYEGLGSAKRLVRSEPHVEAPRWLESQTKNRMVDVQKRVADLLGAEWPGTDIWSMQMKYLALAVGSCDLMVRVPKAGYHGCVWDHAGGQLIFRETGGVVTDAEGKEMDFTRGRKLVGNHGIVAAGTELHGRALRAVARVMTESAIKI